jgi:hypothetical protein
VFKVAAGTLEGTWRSISKVRIRRRMEERRGKLGQKFTCTVTSCSFAHDDVAGFVVDDDANADEGAGEICHCVLNSMENHQRGGYACQFESE